MEKRRLEKQLIVESVESVDIDYGQPAKSTRAASMGSRLHRTPSSAKAARGRPAE